MSGAMKAAQIETDKGYAGVCECGYVTDGWPTVKLAAERVGQHTVEHETGQRMELLSEFRDRHGLKAEGARAVFADDGSVEMLEG